MIMKKILFINSFIREESRTFQIADYILKHIKEEHSLEVIDLNTLKLEAYNQKLFYNLFYLSMPNPFIEYAKKIKEADIVFIAAPFYDMGIPALLRVFFERCSLNGITFTDTGKTCTGLCNNTKMFFVTTRGMDISDGSTLEQATPYLKALCSLWGLKDFRYISAYNLDYLSSNEVNKRIKEASIKGSELFNSYLLD